VAKALFELDLDLGGLGVFGDIRQGFLEQEEEVLAKIGRELPGEVYSFALGR
jgi:hypothetical protein